MGPAEDSRDMAERTLDWDCGLMMTLCRLGSGEGASESLPHVLK